MAEPHTEAVGLLQAGRFREAAGLLESSCGRDPGDARAWFPLAACHHAMHELDRALAAFERSLALDPENLQAAQAAIAAFFEGGKPEIALGRCKALLSQYPDDAQLHFSTALVCEAIGDLSAALRHYDRALALDSGFLGALQNRGFVLTRLGRLDEAIESNRRFVDARPQSVEAHYNLAESCLAARRYDDAISAARRDRKSTRLNSS